MNNSLIDLLHCQLRMQNDSIHALQVIHGHSRIMQMIL